MTNNRKLKKQQKIDNNSEGRNESRVNKSNSSSESSLVPAGDHKWIRGHMEGGAWIPGRRK